MDQAPLSCRILVAPLNWGLGHVTRCVPIIRYLKEQGHEVILASDGEAKTMLTHEFPDLTCLELPAYNVAYRTKSMVKNMAMQLPKLAATVSQEYIATQQIIKKFGITHIISDNRYGCRSELLPSVIITHQLQIFSENKIAQWVGNQLMTYAHRKFDAIWVPDSPELETSLSGSLSHGVKIKTPIQFIGPLSRMKPASAEREYDVIMVLSGPEPQRSYLESLLLEQALTLPMEFLLVEGRPHENKQYFASDNVEVVSYLTSEALNYAINASRVVVCRSGYSSIMDLAALGKKALLIPTPGQTEQEYLAKSLQERGIFPYQTQDALNLQEGVFSVSKYSGLHSAKHTFQKHADLWLSATAKTSSVNT